MRSRLLLAFVLFLAAPRAAQAIEWNGNSFLIDLTGDMPVHRLIAVHGAVRYVADPHQNHSLVFMAGATVPFLHDYALTLRYGQENRWEDTDQSATQSVSVLFRAWLPESGIGVRIEGAGASHPKTGPAYRGWYGIDFRFLGREALGRQMFTKLRPAFTGGTSLGFKGTLPPLAVDVGTQIEQADFDILAGPHIAAYRHGSPWRLEFQYLNGHRYGWSHEARTVIRLEF